MKIIIMNGQLMIGKKYQMEYIIMNLLLVIINGNLIMILHISLYRLLIVKIICINNY